MYGIKGKLEEFRSKGHWWNFGYIAMHLSLLFPDRKRELRLDDKDFEGMKGKLEEYRSNGNWWRFGCIAMNLSVLAAERAEILNGQIVIKPKLRKLTQAPRPLPERSQL